MKMLKLMFGNITHQSASYLNQCHQSKELSICFYSITNCEVLRYLSSLPIEVLSINNCEWIAASEMVIVIRSYLYLTHFTLCDSNNISTSFLRYLAENAEGVPNMLSLKYLNITMPRLQNSNMDDIIARILKKHSRICELFLFFEEILDNILKAISCHLPNVERLYLGKLTYPSKHSIYNVISSCPMLSKLKLRANCLIKGFPISYENDGTCLLTLNRTDIDHTRVKQSSKVIDV